ncbi:MAG: hypothetical protein ABIK89_19385 [Planctomycetota bacterium]
MRNLRVVLGALLVLLACAPLLCSGDARPERPTIGRPLSELTGTLHGPTKIIERYYLISDGSRERCRLRGRKLKEFKEGTRVCVKGILRSYLFEDSRDYTAPGAPAPPPFRKGWIVYMDVKEIQAIARPFGDRGEKG